MPGATAHALITAVAVAMPLLMFNVNVVVAKQPVVLSTTRAYNTVPSAAANTFACTFAPLFASAWVKWYVIVTVAAAWVVTAPFASFKVNKPVVPPEIGQTCSPAGSTFGEFNTVNVREAVATPQDPIGSALVKVNTIGPL
jgi:hypothetical protein